MEYYVAIEIFKHKREQEDLIVNNFHDANWQNVAVFYAGKSRDMPDFLNKIISIVSQYDKVNTFFASVTGLGYLLQALYQTDNILRKKAILLALETNIKAYETLLKVIADEKMIAFKNLSIPVIATMNLLYFIENFNSITLKHPLELSFIDLFKDYKNTNNTTTGFKALKVAITLNTPRINNDTELESLLYETDILKSPMLNILADLGTSMFKSDNYKNIKSEINKKFKKLNVGSLLEKPAKKLRFTEYDTIKTDKRIKIFTEGKTDSEIIDHAYKVLSENRLPYWSIQTAGNESGGSYEVFKLLMSSKPVIGEDEIFIGIFDNDASGIQNFNGLKEKVFKLLPNSKRIKKHISKNIYALKLPVPPDKSYYVKTKQEFNFFAIEHYFSEKLLEEHSMLVPTDLPDIYAIKSAKSAKNNFSKFIRKSYNHTVFKDFIYLFREIDNISEIEEIDYID